MPPAITRTTAKATHNCFRRVRMDGDFMIREKVRRWPTWWKLVTMTLTAFQRRQGPTRFAESPATRPAGVASGGSLIVCKIDEVPAGTPVARGLPLW